MPKFRSKVGRKRKFHGNRHSIPTNADTSCVQSASSSKLKMPPEETQVLTDISNCELQGNRIVDIVSLISVFSLLCCPECLQIGLTLHEDSRFGLVSNFCLKCRCGYYKGFSSTPKCNSKNSLNSLLVFGLRLIGKGYTAGKKLLCTLNLPYISKAAFRQHECKLLASVKLASEKNMKEASKEVRVKKTPSPACGISVDGTWQRRGHTSLNGCVSLISIDTGKILDVEVMSQYCRVCETSNKTRDHTCSNHKGSSGSMEVFGAYRMFDRSLDSRDLKYAEYYGDGDSKAYTAVKDIYGEDSVTKLECIGHIQKRVGSRLRKFKKITQVSGVKAN